MVGALLMLGRDARGKLLGGLLREGRYEDSRRLHVLLEDEVCHTLDEREGLTRAESGRDEHRPFGRGDGTALLVVCIAKVECLVHGLQPSPQPYAAKRINM